MTDRSVSSIGTVQLNEHSCHRRLSIKLFGDIQNILFDMTIVCDTLTFVSIHTARTTTRFVRQDQALLQSCQLICRSLLQPFIVDSTRLSEVGAELRAVNFQFLSMSLFSEQSCFVRALRLCCWWVCYARHTVVAQRSARSTKSCSQHTTQQRVAINQTEFVTTRGPLPDTRWHCPR